MKKCFFSFYEEEKSLIWENKVLLRETFDRSRSILLRLGLCVSICAKDFHILMTGSRRKRTAKQKVDELGISFFVVVVIILILV